MVNKSDQLIAERLPELWAEASDVADKAPSSRRGIKQAAATVALEEDRSQLKELVKTSESGSILEKSRHSANLDRFSLQKLQNAWVKKGPPIPASGCGSPGSRQTLPLPEAGHEVTHPGKTKPRSPRVSSKANSKKENDDRRDRRKLPELPEGLSWPQADYDKAPEYGTWGGLEAYLKNDIWKPLIPYIDMATLRTHYPRLGEAIDRQRAKLVRKGVVLPLVEREVTDKILESYRNRGDRPLRVEWALQNRAYRARRKVKKQQIRGGADSIDLG